MTVQRSSSPSFLRALLPRPGRSARRALALLPLLVLLLGGAPARATLLQPLSLTDLVRKADRLAVVQVGGARSFWEGKRIYTHTEAKVGELLKGKGVAAGDTLTVRQLGGKVGDRELVVPGTPRLRTGERYLLFLLQDAQGKPYHYLLGMGQGAVRLQPGDKSSEALLAQVRALVEATR